MGYPLAVDIEEECPESEWGVGGLGVRAGKLASSSLDTQAKHSKALLQPQEEPKGYDRQRKDEILNFDFIPLPPFCFLWDGRCHQLLSCACLEIVAVICDSGLR